jgi:hypothetical protein
MMLTLGHLIAIYCDKAGVKHSSLAHTPPSQSHLDGLALSSLMFFADQELLKAYAT